MPSGEIITKKKWGIKGKGIFWKKRKNRNWKENATNYNKLLNKFVLLMENSFTKSVAEKQKVRKNEFEKSTFFVSVTGVE